VRLRQGARGSRLSKQRETADKISSKIDWDDKAKKSSCKIQWLWGRGRYPHWFRENRGVQCQSPKAKWAKWDDASSSNETRMPMLCATERGARAVKLRNERRTCCYLPPITLTLEEFGLPLALARLGTP